MAHPRKAARVGPWVACTSVIVSAESMCLLPLYVVRLVLIVLEGPVLKVIVRIDGVYRVWISGIVPP